MLLRRLKQVPRETSSLPRLPAAMSAQLAGPLAAAALLRAVLHDRGRTSAAASTHLRPSKTLWLHGFSTYTSLPAWQAQMVISECQWLQVATLTASSSLSSRALRMSCTHLGAVPVFCLIAAARPAKSELSGSIR